MIRNKRFFNKARRFLIRKDINVLHWNADYIEGVLIKTSFSFPSLSIIVSNSIFFYGASILNNKAKNAQIDPHNGSSSSVFQNSLSNATNTHINRGGRIFKFLHCFNVQHMFINPMPLFYMLVVGGRPS
ncbi:MAG: hypothetical protein LBC39_01295 [Methanobrevibacter sp.]|jgi:hypothetical protein|nr:hypothetical protein [Candidatus Methanovirga aequatorialis]